MLNIFPIQFLAPIAYLIVRICVGILLIRLGSSHYRHRESLQKQCTCTFFPYRTGAVILFAASEVAVGVLFLVGLYTQIAALVSMVYAVIFLASKKQYNPLFPSRDFYILLLAVSLSLFITGAGILAFDLPI